jgi:phosphoserine phosphatase
MSSSGGKHCPGLVVFDLDGTVLRGKTVCELLAVPLRRQERMHQIERLRSESEISEARLEMAAWYRDVPVERLLSYLEKAAIAPGALESFDLLRRNGFECAISSITWMFAVRWFAERLNVAHFQGTDILGDGRITHVWPRDKGTWVRELTTVLGVRPDRVAAIGDSWRDLDMFQASARAFFVGRPHEGRDLPASVVRVAGGDLLTVARTLVHDWTELGSAPGA